MTRSEIREQVFKLLFMTEFNPVSEMDKQVDYYFKSKETEYAEGIVEAEEIEDAEYTGKMVILDEKAQQEISQRLNLVIEKLPEINEVIEKNVSDNWPVHRMGKAELTIIRLALYEIKYDDLVPTAVAINEAVELAKKYGQDEAGSFINGVLANLVKSLEA